ncbi:UNVERIFIED_CONTAM: hypothetical protein NCL1_62979 [Trichonephila clavipes]
MEERCTFHFPKTPSCQLHSVTAASNKHCLEIAWLSLYLKQASRNLSIMPSDITTKRSLNAWRQGGLKDR